MSSASKEDVTLPIDTAKACQALRSAQVEMSRLCLKISELQREQQKLESLLNSAQEVGSSGAGIDMIALYQESLTMAQALQATFIENINLKGMLENISVSIDISHVPVIVEDFNEQVDDC